jgi:hypothetical protein
MAISGVFTFACTIIQLFDVMGKHGNAVAAFATYSGKGRPAA